MSTGQLKEVDGILLAIGVAMHHSVLAVCLEDFIILNDMRRFVSWVCRSLTSRHPIFVHHTIRGNRLRHHHRRSRHSHGHWDVTHWHSHWSSHWAHGGVGRSGLCNNRRADPSLSDHPRLPGVLGVEVVDPALTTCQLVELDNVLPAVGVSVRNRHNSRCLEHFVELHYMLRALSRKRGAHSGCHAVSIDQTVRRRAASRDCHSLNLAHARSAWAFWVKVVSPTSAITELVEVDCECSAVGVRMLHSDSAIGKELFLELQHATSLHAWVLGVLADCHTIFV